MTSPTPSSGRAEAFRALGVLAEPPGPHHARLAGLLGLEPPSRSDWTEAFVVHLVPHASIYLSADGMLGGEAADRVAGFWRALKLPVPSDPDHLTALLGVYATLLEAEAGDVPGPSRALLRQAATALLHEHLLSWLLAYTSAMIDIGPASYATWAALLRDALIAEAAARPDLAAPGQLPLHLRDVPALPPGASSVDDVMAVLLAPARSGIVLARGHLGRAAHHGSLGLRLGDRRRMLRSLLEQEPRATLRWLVAHARQWELRHRADGHDVGAAAAFWADRAASTAAWLRSAELELDVSMEPTSAPAGVGPQAGE
jgi:hypothetical protein